MNQQNLPLPGNEREIDVENKTLIASLQAEIERLKTELANVQKSARVDAALVRLGAKNPVAVRALISLDSIQEEQDGTLKGLDEAVAALKEQEAYLFHDSPKAGFYGFSPAESAQNNANDPFVKGFMGI